MSARQISAMAGIPVSSIYHHFGSLEHLFLSAQEACLTEAEAWVDAQLLQLEGMARSIGGFAGFFAQIVDEWCDRRRDLAFAWRECQLLARQSPLFHATGHRWAALWNRLWHEAGQRFALPEQGVVAKRIFDSESFAHMIRWRRLVDRAGLDDTARTLGAWLAGTPMPPAPWREFARDEALRSTPELPERDEVAARIVESAARIIGDEGLARLTHRAVADRAGLTLGTVSHKFRTKSALLEAGFEGLYRANVEKSQGDGPVHGTDLVPDIMDMIRHGSGMRGSDELFLATARDPGLSQFGAQLRYSRGRTSRGVLQAMVGSQRTITITEAALFSSFLTSQLRRNTDNGQDAGDDIRGELDILLSLARDVPSS